MPISILMIDDEPRVLRAFARNVRLGGYTVITAEGGRAGLELYHQELPEIVITDLRMPDLSGQQVLEAIRAHDPEANVILVTGHGDQDAILEALRAGASDFLPKPVDQVTLESALRRAAERVHLKRELRANQAALRQQNARLEEEVAKRTAELEETLKKYRVLFESFPLGITIADSAGEILEINQQSEQLLGLSQEEHAQRKIDGEEWRIIRPDGSPMPPEEYASVRALQEGRLIRNVEMGIVKPDAVTWISVTAAPLNDHRVVITYNDVTERKRAEAAILDERERLGNILAALETGLSLINPDMTIAWVNRKTHAMFPGAEPVGQICHRFYEGRETPCENCGTQLAFRTGEVQTRERQNPVTGRWYAILSQPLKDEQGNVINVIEGITDITERKQREDALRASEARFRGVFESSPTGIALVNTATQRFTEANDSFLDILGYSLEELQQLIVGDVTHPEDWEREADLVQAYLDGELPSYEVEKRYIRKDGEIRWVRTTGDVLLVDPDKPPLAIANVEDITARKQAEAQVQHHLDELRAWHRVALHRETRLTELKQEVNALLARLAEPPRYQDPDEASDTTALDAAIMAVSPSDIIIPQTSLEKWQGITNLLAEVFRVPAALIMKVEPPDITVFVASHSEDNPYHPGERAALNTGLYCETVMSTRQKLLVPNALHDEHWDHNPDIPLGMISYLGFPVRWPDGAIFGTLCVLDTKENAYGPTYEQLLAQFRDIVETDLRTHWEGALQQQYATQTRRALLSMLEDAHRMETQLQEYADHLEQMVDEQVQQLEQERTKIIQMDKLASLGQLATSIAHELHQPLTAITFDADYLKTLADQVDVVALDLAELMKIGQEIEEDVARCRRIIDHLRSFGRVAAEDTAPVDLNRPLKDSFILIGAQLRDHQVTVDLHLAEDLPYIQANPHKLEQVFLNLIANAEYALQEAAEQDGRDKILTLSTRQEGDWVIAEVRDNGLGIPEDVQQRLFEPFFTTKPEGAGTGLGLSICDNIVTDIGGEITYQSTEGEGTTFTLRFPVESTG